MKIAGLIILFIGQIFGAETWHTFQGYEYLIVLSPVVNSYQAAKSECAARNSTVANVKTTELHNFLVGKIDTLPEFYSFFIGATKKQGGFEWTDGTKLSETQAQWTEGEPNNSGGKENCVTIGLHWTHKGYKWFDIPCSVPSRYICQQIIPTTTMTKTTTTAVKTLSSTLQATRLLSTFPTTHSLTTNRKLNAETSGFTAKMYNTTAQGQPDGESGLLLAAVIPSVAGCVIVVASVAAIFLICRKRTRSKAFKKATENEYAEIDEARNTDQGVLNHDPTQTGNTYDRVGNVVATTEDQTPSHAYGSVYNEAYSGIPNSMEVAMYASADNNHIPQQYENREATNQRENYENSQNHEMNAVDDKYETEIKQQNRNSQSKLDESSEDVYAVVDKKNKK